MSCKKNSFISCACGSALFIPITLVATFSLSCPWMSFVLYFSKINSILSVISSSIASNSRLRPTYCWWSYYGGRSRFFAVEFIFCGFCFVVKYCRISLVCNFALNWAALWWARMWLWLLVIHCRSCHTSLAMMVSGVTVATISWRWGSCWASCIIWLTIACSCVRSSCRVEVGYKC